MYLGVLWSKLRPKWDWCHLCGRGARSVVEQLLMESWGSSGVRFQKGTWHCVWLPQISVCSHVCDQNIRDLQGGSRHCAPLFFPHPTVFSELGNDEGPHCPT